MPINNPLWTDEEYEEVNKTHEEEED